MTGSSAPGRPTDRSRRAVLVTAIASAVGTAGCSWSGDDEGYDRSDHEMTFGLECVDPAAGRYVARLAWEWANGADGSAPRDVVLVYWDADRWEWTGDGGETTDAVAYDSWYSDTERRSRVEFLHRDTAADADQEDAAATGYRRSATWRRPTGVSSQRTPTAPGLPGKARATGPATRR